MKQSYTDATRGQLLLVGGIVIALSLVALVVVLNSVLVTENLETQATTGPIDAAATYQSAGTTEYRRYIAELNNRSYQYQYNAYQDALIGIHDINTLLGEHLAKETGYYATFDSPELVNGTVLRQTNPTCDFIAGDGSCPNNASVSAPTTPRPQFTISPVPGSPGSLVSFDGSSSSDPNGNVLAYDWDFTSDGLVDSTGETTTTTYLSPGTYNATLTVTDDSLESASTSRYVAIRSTTATDPTASYSYTPTSPTSNQTITLDASASTPNNGTISGYEWDFDGDGFPDERGQSVTFDPPIPGDYTISLTVFDSEGAVDSYTQTISVRRQPSACTGFTVGGGCGPYALSPPPTGSVTLAPGDTDWTLATTPNVSEFQLTADSSNIDGTVDGTDILDPLILRSTAFHVLAEDSDGDQWRLYIYRTLLGDTVVSTQQNNGPVTVHYRGTTSTLSVDLQDGRINGQDKSFTIASNLDSPYTINYRNGNALSGTYHVVIPSDSPSTNIETQNFFQVHDGYSPFISHGIHSIRLPLTFDGDTIYYKTNLTVYP